MANNSLLYLHKKNTASTQIKKDFDYLIELLRSEGLKRKRWHAYRQENESLTEDGEVHAHGALMEHLAFKESVIEGLDEEKILMLMWVGRFQGLYELISEQVDAEHESADVFKNLKSDYVKKMLANTFSISEGRKNLPEDSFDYVDFFDSLERRAHLNTALRVAEQKNLDAWNMLAADMLLDHLTPLIEHGKKYRSVRVYLQKNAEAISNALENHFSHEHVNRKISRDKAMDITPAKVKEIKKAWRDFQGKK